MSLSNTSILGSTSRNTSLIGQSFCDLTVESLSPHSDLKRARYWNCRCICGAARRATTNELINGGAKRCHDCAKHKSRKSFWGRHRKLTRIENGSNEKL